MKILSTPHGAAAGLADYPFEPNFTSVPDGDGGNLRMHYVDIGPRTGRPVVFLHGNPSWSYIWRHPLEALSELGFRAIAVDLVGMGLSDKPSELTDYTVARHVAWTRSLLIDALELQDAVLVLHDWGGIIGLRLLADSPDRFAGVAISNTGLPERDPAEPLPQVVEAKGPFVDFQNAARLAPVWEPWKLLPIVMVTPPSENVVAGYHAPYPEAELTIGSRAFTQLLPTRPDNPMLPDNWKAWQALEHYRQPLVTIFSDKDSVAPHGWKPLVERIPGAKGQPHTILAGGGHFLQEDIPDAYTGALLDWLRANSF